MATGGIQQIDGSAGGTPPGVQGNPIERQRYQARRRQSAAQYTNMAQAAGVPVTAAGRAAFQDAMDQYLAGGGAGGAGVRSSGGGGGGGGGRGYGGGGGGGGGGVTQAMFDQAVALLGKGMQGPQLQAGTFAPFQGQNINPFQEAMYQQLRQQLAQAVTQDRANVEQIIGQTRGQLEQNYANPYAGMAVEGAPAPATEGEGLVAPGGLEANAAQQQIENRNSQAAFQNLLGVLAGASDQSQQSRLHQLNLDRQTALNQIGAQNTGLGAQIGMARNKAYEQWLRQDEERRYQNSLMAQQWAREEAMRKADIANQQAQAQYTARNNVLQPLLDLLARSGGGVNMASLQQLIGRM